MHHPAGILMPDIQEGCTAETREALAWKLVGACQEILGFTNENLNLEFTEHRGMRRFTRVSAA